MKLEFPKAENFAKMTEKRNKRKINNAHESFS